MSYLGTKPGHQVATAQQIADGVITPAKLSLGAPTWDTTGQLTLLRNDTTNEGGQLNFQKALDGTQGWYIDCYGNTSTPTLRFVSGATVALAVDGSNNVGIGTSSPGSRLTIAGNTEFRSFDGTTLGYVNGSNGTAGLQFDVYGSNTIKFTTAGSERVRIDSSGNVGIGTNSPGYKLEVGGGNGTLVRFTGTGGQFQGFGVRNNYGSASQAADVFYDVVNETGAAVANMLGSIQTDGGSSWSWGTQPPGARTDRRVERMRIDASGNLLVGVNSSLGTGTLQVRGGILGDLGASNGNFSIEARGGTLYSASIYNSTTAAGASVSITGTGGFLQRSTSSIKYKTDVEDLDLTKSELIYQMRPVWYRSKCETDRKDWSYYGLIAEELAEIEPRLVHWGVAKEDGTQEPEGVMYERLTVLLLAEMKKQKAAIQEQQTMITTQQAAIDQLKTEFASQQAAIEKLKASIAVHKGN